jgi:hypothetical protein
LQPGRGRRGGDEIDNHFMTNQRPAPPVLTNVGEEPLFNLVPLTRTRR